MIPRQTSSTDGKDNGPHTVLKKINLAGIIIAGAFPIVEVARGVANGFDLFFGVLWVIFLLGIVTPHIAFTHMALQEWDVFPKRAAGFLATTAALYLAGIFLIYMNSNGPDWQFGVMLLILVITPGLSAAAIADYYRLLRRGG